MGILPVLTVRRREDNTETELTNYKTCEMDQNV